MQVYEFNDGCGIHFGIVANDMDEAVKFAAIECEEDVEQYKVHVVSDDEAKRREITDEDTGRRYTIYEAVSEHMIDGNIKPAMLWHSEI